MSKLRAYILSLLAFVAFALLTIKIAPLFVNGDWLGPVTSWANILALAAAFIAPAFFGAKAFEQADAQAARLQAELEKLREAIFKREGASYRSAIAVDRPSDNRAINLTFTRTALQYRSAGGAASGELSNILGYFNSLRPKRLIILGAPGAGKTVASLTLIRDIINDPSRQAGDPVPVRVPVNSYRDGSNLQDWIAERLQLDYQVGRKTAERFAKEGRVIPVLDGLDELDSEPGNPTRAAAVVSIVNDYVRGTDPAPVVVLCREAAYGALPHGVEEATEVIINPMAEATFTDYYRRQFRSPGEDLAWSNVLNGATGTFGLQVQTSLIAALGSPWLVGASLAASRAGVSPDSIFFIGTPAGNSATVRPLNSIRLSILRTFVQTRISVSANTSDTQYNAPDVTRWLAMIARHLRTESLAGRPSDIRLDTWWRAFPASRPVHAALATIVSTVCVVMIYAGIDGQRVLPGPTVDLYIGNVDRLDPAFTTAAALAIISLISIILLSVRLTIVSDSIPVRFTRNVFSTLKGWASALLFSLAGGALGTTIGVLVSLTNSLSVGASKGVAVGCVGGAAAGLITGIFISLGRERDERDDPIDAITSGFLYSLAIGVGMGALGAVGGVITTGILFGTSAAATLFVLFGLIWGPVASVRYFIAVTLLFARGRTMPFRFGRMIRWAVVVGILRRTGATLQFAHKEFEDALALGQI